jgi:hypothetical protein
MRGMREKGDPPLIGSLTLPPTPLVIPAQLLLLGSRTVLFFYSPSAQSILSFEKMEIAGRHYFGYFRHVAIYTRRHLSLDGQRAAPSSDRSTRAFAETPST